MDCCKWIDYSTNSSFQNTETRVTPDLIMSDSPPLTSPATALPFVHPLDDFYARAVLRLPKIERIAGDQVPEPYRALLVHENDMTPTLEKYHEEKIHLNLLGRDERGDFYFRQVVLE